MKTRAVVAILVVLVSGCSVRGQDGPERLPSDVLPSDLRPSAVASSPAPPTTTVPVYLVEDGRLVRQERPARRRTVGEALTALLTDDGADGTRRSAVPPGTVVERLSVRGPLLSVELSAQFAGVRGNDQLLAVAQIVWTATEFPPVRQVDVFVGGRRLDLPVEQGEFSSGPADRDDYQEVGPAP